MKRKKTGKKPLKKPKVHKAAIEEEWNESDFVQHLSSIMRKQERENPELGYVHERLTPEYDNIRSLIESLLQVEAEGQEIEVIKKIAAYHDNAVLPLIDFILQLKKMKNEP